MTTFTSTLPEDLFSLLNQKAKELNMPKNKLIEKALSLYLKQLEKAEYVKSYKRMANDVDVLLMVEEGMADYFIHLAKEEEK